MRRVPARRPNASPAAAASAVCRASCPRTPEPLGPAAFTEHARCACFSAEFSAQRMRAHVQPRSRRPRITCHNGSLARPVARSHAAFGHFPCAEPLGPELAAEGLAGGRRMWYNPSDGVDGDTLGARNTTAFGSPPWTGPKRKRGVRQVFRLRSFRACAPCPSAGRKSNAENGDRGAVEQPACSQSGPTRAPRTPRNGRSCRPTL